MSTTRLRLKSLHLEEDAVEEDAEHREGHGSAALRSEAGHKTAQHHDGGVKPMGGEKGKIDEARDQKSPTDEGETKPNLKEARAWHGIAPADSGPPARPKTSRGSSVGRITGMPPAEEPFLMGRLATQDEEQNGRGKERGPALPPDGPSDGEEDEAEVKADAVSGGRCRG